MHIHILGIVGNKTAPLAIALTEQGHVVTGSDQEKIYPPFSTLLEQNNILINQTTISSNIDLAIIGNSYSYFDNCRQEFELIKKLNIPYVSYTEYIIQNLIKKDSILVAGAYGKTTITALLSFVLQKLDLDPSYMFGGFSQDNLPSTYFGNSSLSVIESDENHNGLDTKPTFLYYPSKYLILTSVNWEHKESFDSFEENLESYRQLINQLPSDGVLIYNQKDSRIIEISQNFKGMKIPYISTNNVDSNLIGKHNQENISAVIALCKYLKLNNQDVLDSITKFHGIKRRLELITNTNQIPIIDDYAQSAARVKSALDAIKYTYPNKKIYVYFEPHASFLQDKQSITDFENIFDITESTIIGKLSFSNKIDKKNRSTAKDWVNLNPNKIIYYPISSQIIDFYKVNLDKDSLLIHFSSGGLEGINNLNLIKQDILDIHL